MYPTERDTCISTIGGIPVAVEGVPFTCREEWAYCVLSIFLAVTRSVSGANKSEGGRGTGFKRRLSGRACVLVLVTTAILV